MLGIAEVSIVAMLVVVGVYGHGRLIEPPSRASMWRYGFNTPANYDDNQLFCGGFQRQWTVNGGKCGVCGDPYDGAREHEAGGKYANGIIVRQFQPAQVIEVKIELTADHKGWFEFRLCPHNSPSTPAQQQCFDNGLMQFTDHTTRYYLPSSSVSGQVHTLSLLLPDVTCSQCILQWKYHTGNSWGCDPDGTCAVGKGPQEEFYGCADISIGNSAGSTTGSSSTPAFTTRTPPIRSTSSATTTSPIRSTSSATTTSSQGRRCKAANEWEGQPAMDNWCTTNCAVGYCPETHCKCTALETTTRRRTTRANRHTTLHQGPSQNTHDKDLVCRAVNSWEGQSDMDSWCQNNCLLGYCPKTHCSCYEKQLECKTFVAINGTELDNLVCEYLCLIEDNCPESCQCSNSDHKLRNCQVTSSVFKEHAQRFCSILCSYNAGSCPQGCNCN